MRRFGVGRHRYGTLFKHDEKEISIVGTNMSPTVDEEIMALADAEVGTLVRDPTAQHVRLMRVRGEEPMGLSTYARKRISKNPHGYIRLVTDKLTGVLD